MICVSIFQRFFSKKGGFCRVFGILPAKKQRQGLFFRGFGLFFRFLDMAPPNSIFFPFFGFPDKTRSGRTELGQPAGKVFKILQRLFVPGVERVIFAASDNNLLRFFFYPDRRTDKTVIESSDFDVV